MAFNFVTTVNYSSGDMRSAESVSGDIYYSNLESTSSISGLMSTVKTTTSSPWSSERFCRSPKLSDTLWVYVGPVIFVIGIVGNFLVLLAASRRPMTGTSTSVYLRCMAAADLITLVTGIIPEWFMACGVFLRDLHPVMCKLEKFVFYTTSDTSIWICVAFTLDRFIAVCFPFLRQSGGNKKGQPRRPTDDASREPKRGCGGRGGSRCCCRCSCNIGGLGCGRPSAALLYAFLALMTAVAKNAHVIWTRGPEYEVVNIVQKVLDSNSSRISSSLDLNETMSGTIRSTVTVYTTTTTTQQLRLVSPCGKPAGYYFEKFVRAWLAFTVVSALPFCVIAFCNVFIVRAMILMRRARRQVSLVSFTTVAGSAVAAAQAAATDSTVFQTTALCLSASMCFLVCITPSMVMAIGKPYWNEPPNDTYAAVKSVSNQIFYVNHSINFFLYCITGKRFRMALRRACWFSCQESGYTTGLSHRTVWSTSAAAAAAAATRRLVNNGNGQCCKPSGHQGTDASRHSCPPGAIMLPCLEKRALGPNEAVRGKIDKSSSKALHGSVGDLIDRRKSSALHEQLLSKLEQKSRHHNHHQQQQQQRPKTRDRGELVIQVTGAVHDIDDEAIESVERTALVVQRQSSV